MRQMLCKLGLHRWEEFGALHCVCLKCGVTRWK